MEKFKQNKLFYSALIAIGLVFVSGVGFSYYKYTVKNATAKELDQQQKKSRALLNGHVLPSLETSVALTPANVDAATKDLADLNTQKEQLKALIAGAPEARIRQRALGLIDTQPGQIARIDTPAAGNPEPFALTAAERPHIRDPSIV